MEETAWGGVLIGCRALGFGRRGAGRLATCAWAFVPRRPLAPRDPGRRCTGARGCWAGWAAQGWAALAVGRPGCCCCFGPERKGEGGLRQEERKTTQAPDLLGINSNIMKNLFELNINQISNEFQTMF